MPAWRFRIIAIIRSFRSPATAACVMVEIEKMPKLQIACNTQVAEGMSVLTQSPKVMAVRKAVIGISADQSSGGLPDLRPSRRVPAAGLLHGA